MPARTAQAGLAAATPAGGMDLNKTRIHDLLTGHPAPIPAPASIRDAARTMVTGGFRHLPAADGTGWIGMRPGRLRLRGRGIASLVRAPLHYRRDDVTVARQDFGLIEEGRAAAHVR